MRLRCALVWFVVCFFFKLMCSLPYFAMYVPLDCPILLRWIVPLQLYPWFMSCITARTENGLVPCELTKSSLECKHKMMESVLKSRILHVTKEDVFSIQRQNTHFFFSPPLNHAAVFRSNFVLLFFRYCSPYKILVLA